MRVECGGSEERRMERKGKGQESMKNSMANDGIPKRINAQRKTH